jgi:NAD(P)-dependent dehydrogenase (short-subunit alcohol dehydrogenase family)
MQLNGSTFIVTGGSFGVAAATVRRFHAAGARLLIADLDVELGEKLAAELGQRARFCATDATREADVRAAISEAQKHFGRLSGLINCTGMANAGQLGLEGVELFSRIVTVDLVGTFNMIRWTVAAMADASEDVQDERGVIVNTVSPAAGHGQVEKAVRAACRAGLCSLSLSLASQLSASGIRVVTITPGRLHRPMVAAWPTASRVSLSESGPFPRCDECPEEYAALVQHVVEHDTSAADGIQVEGPSQREFEVLRLVAQGKTNKEIGKILGISARTAQVHVSNIYGKIGVCNRASAVLWLIEHQARTEDYGNPLEGLLAAGMSSS